MSMMSIYTRFTLTLIKGTTNTSFLNKCLEAGTLFGLKTEALIDELTEKRTYHVGLL